MSVKERAAKYFTEFFGTFFLVFTVSCAVTTTTDTSPNTLIPLGVGAALMVAIYAGGYISGAHYNPAVSMACYVRGALGLVDFFAYVGIQVLAGFLANLIAYGMTKRSFALAPSVEYGWFSAFVVEFFYTYLLTHVVLHVATSKTQAGNSFFGLAIGFAVTAGAVSVGKISGGGFNPAVATGPAIVDAMFSDSGDGRWIWLYWFAPMLAGACAGLMYRIFNKDKEAEEP